MVEEEIFIYVFLAVVALMVYLKKAAFYQLRPLDNRLVEEYKDL